MQFNGKQSKKIQGRRARLPIIVIFQYAVLLLSGLSSAAAIYLVFGARNSLLIASSTTTLVAAGISTTYLLMHQCGAWKYCQGGIKLPLKERNLLLAWSRIANILSIPTWIAAFVLGLAITLNSHFCGRDQANNADWQRWSINGCSIQKAHIAVALAASISSLVLFCMLATVEHPFAASLAGVRLRDLSEEEMLRLSTANWPSPSPPRGNAPRCSYDTSVYTPSFRSTTPRQESWLPKLSFDTPTDRNHPAYRVSTDDSQPLRHKESNLLPSPTVLRHSQGFSPVRSVRGRPTFKRSATTDIATSSMYSQSTVADSAFSNRASSISSFSDDSSFFSPLKSPPPLGRTFSCNPAVPCIPEHYLMNPTATGPLTQDRPLRSGSRTRPPSPQIFDCAEYECENNDCIMEEDLTHSTPIRHSRRHTEYPLIHQSLQKEEDTVVKDNLNRRNTTTIGGRVGKWTYESFRKGRTMDARRGNPWGLLPRSDGTGVEFAPPSPGKCERSRAERRRLRNLVKKRQPGDIALRINTGNGRSTL